MDAVTQILIDRSHQADTISRMVVVSLVLHGVLISAVALAPRFIHQPAVENKQVMTISLAGAPGPVQGHNPIAPKPVQEAVATAKPKPEAPPALPKPEMVEPLKNAKTQPKTAAKPEPKKEVQQLHGRTPTTGAEVKRGNARVETNSTAQTPFGGLATGGGGTGGAYTDYANFCCPEYLQTITRLVYTNWQQRQGQEGSNKLVFTIRRDGTISDVKVEEGANAYLNLASQRALLATQKLPPLPAAYTGDHLTLHFVFQYKR